MSVGIVIHISVKIYNQNKLANIVPDLVIFYVNFGNVMVCNVHGTNHNITGSSESFES